MFRRTLHQKAVDDDGGQGQVDQDIAQGFAALPGNLARFEQRVANGRQQEHLQDLPGQYHRHFHWCSLAYRYFFSRSNTVR